MLTGQQAMVDRFEEERIQVWASDFPLQQTTHLVEKVVTDSFSDEPNPKGHSQIRSGLWFSKISHISQARGAYIMTLSYLANGMSNSYRAAGTAAHYGI
jgi:hypothetical protein